MVAMLSDQQGKQPPQRVQISSMIDQPGMQQLDSFAGALRALIEIGEPMQAEASFGAQSVAARDRPIGVEVVRQKFPAQQVAGELPAGQSLLHLASTFGGTGLRGQ